MAEPVPILQKPFATANDNMIIPTNNNGSDNHTSLPSIADDYLKNTKGFLTGNNQLGFFTAQDNLYNWQIDQRCHALNAAGANISADLNGKDNFFIAPSGSTLTMVAPTNAPSMSVYGSPYMPIYFRVYARNASVDSAGKIIFNSSWTAMADSHQYTRAGGATGLNVIHCWWMPNQNVGWYKIENAYGGLIPFEVTITSAQLLANTYNEIIPAQGAGTFIDIIGRPFVRNVGGTSAYTGAGALLMSGDLKTVFGDLNLELFPDDQYFVPPSSYLPDTPNICQANQSVGLVLVGGISGGDYDVYISGFYRVTTAP
jgi:hypothetical protein